MKNKGKLLLFSLLTLAMMMMFAGCGTKTAEGQITAIDGTTLTVSLGEMAEQSDEEMTAPTGEDGDESATPNSDDSTDSDSTDSDSDTDSTDTSTDSDEVDETSNTSTSSQATTTVSDDTTTDSSDTTVSSDDTTTDSEDESDTDTEVDGSGSEPPDMSDKEAPADMEEGGNGFFTASGDTITIDVSDVTITLSDGSEGTIDDLSSGDILSITYTGDYNVSAITVEMSINMNGGPGGGSPPEEPATDDESATDEDSTSEDDSTTEDDSSDSTDISSTGYDLTAEYALNSSTQTALYSDYATGHISQYSVFMENSVATSERNTII